jgi:plasmid stabilization system protein ParE
MTGYALHPEARFDLDEIWEYIASDNVTAADRVIADIHQALDGLAPFPHQGHRRPDITSRPLRFAIVRDYLIAYAPDEKPLWVIAVMHGRRSPRVMAAILRGPTKSMYRLDSANCLEDRNATRAQIVARSNRWNAGGGVLAGRAFGTAPEGSTRLLQELGDKYAQVVGDHRRIMRGAMEGHGGTEIDTQGDAFFFSFPRAKDAAEPASAAHPPAALD